MDEETKSKIKKHYQLGQGSIQDIARVYRYSVEEILDVLGLGDMSTIESSGDLIGQDEAGDEVTIKATNKFKQKYTLN